MPSRPVRRVKTLRSPRRRRGKSLKSRRSSSRGRRYRSNIELRDRLQRVSNDSDASSAYDELRDILTGNEETLHAQLRFGVIAITQGEGTLNDALREGNLAGICFVYAAVSAANAIARYIGYDKPLPNPSMSSIIGPYINQVNQDHAEVGYNPAEAFSCGGGFADSFLKVFFRHFSFGERYSLEIRDAGEYIPRRDTKISEPKNSEIHYIGCLVNLKDPAHVIFIDASMKDGGYSISNNETIQEFASYKLLTGVLEHNPSYMDRIEQVLQINLQESMDIFAEHAFDARTTDDVMSALRTADEQRQP